MNKVISIKEFTKYGLLIRNPILNSSHYGPLEVPDHILQDLSTLLVKTKDDQVSIEFEYDESEDDTIVGIQINSNGIPFYKKIQLTLLEKDFNNAMSCWQKLPPDSVIKPSIPDFLVWTIRLQK